MKKYFEFHDGSLDGLLVEGDSAYVFVSTLNQERFVIESLGVAALSADNFKQGNIIFEVLISSADELTVEDIEAVHGGFPEVSKSRFSTRGLELALEKGLSFLAIHPSYGSTCLVLAATFKLCTRREWEELHKFTQPGSKAKIT